MIAFNEPHLQPITNSLIQNAGVRVFILRLDEMHPQVNGNKWFKLKLNIEEAKHQNQKSILSFGGAFSNHIYALAAAGKAFGIKTIGIIRGEESSIANETLSFASKSGMDLHFISRENYRKKNDPIFINTLINNFDNPYIVPEGGANTLGAKGSEEIYSITKLLLQKENVKASHFILACGTGTTLAGIVNASTSNEHIIGVPVLKDGGFLKNEIDWCITPNDQQKKYELLCEYHFGGYAKTTPELQNFIQSAEQEMQLPLEPVYTGKMIYALFDKIKSGYFKEGSVIVAIHTGGLRPNT